MMSSSELIGIMIKDILILIGVMIKDIVMNFKVK